MRFSCVVAAAAGAVLLTTLAGCGGSSSAEDEPSTPPSTVTETATPTPSPSSTAPTSAAPTTAAPSPTSGSGSGPAECRTADVRFKVVGGGGAAGSDYSQIVMSNTSTQTCVTGGYGGVSYVANGAVVGAPAARDRSVPSRRIVLRPGQQAKAQLQEAVAENYPAGRCRPTTVSGLRIYPPDETHPVEVRHSATGCAATGVKLLHLQPYRAG